MSKTQLVSTSFVAAIPGGFLLYLMLMAVLSHLPDMPTILKVATISLLVMSIILVIFPFYLLLFFGHIRGVAPAPVTKTPPKKDAKPAKSEPKESEVFVADDDGESFEDDGESEVFTMEDEGEVEAFDDSGDEELFDAGDDDFEFEEFDFDEDEEL
ncbi:MAG: hypothetical protein R3C18_10085 [Planctomycetaceae bacterium]